MVVLHGQTALPSYWQVFRALRSGDTQCIWQIESLAQRCRVCLTTEEIKNAFRLTCVIYRAKSLTLIFDALLQLVQLLCCDQKHRDYVQNRKYDSQLAERWESEIAAEFLNSTEGQESAFKQTLAPIKREAYPETATIPVNVVASEDIKGDDAEVSFLLEKIKLENSHTSKLFRQHKRLPDETVASKLLRRLGKKDLTTYNNGKRGFLYLFSQKAIQGMVKIGYTNASIQSRLTFWSKCGHGIPVLLQSFDTVPCAERVETLIHFELLSHWRKERHCAHHRTAHVEWFEMDAEKAIEVAKNWVSWIKSAQPYDIKGDLKEPWVSTMHELIANDIPITSRMLLDLWDLETPNIMSSPVNSEVPSMNLRSRRIVRSGIRQEVVAIGS